MLVYIYGIFQKYTTFSVEKLEFVRGAASLQVMNGSYLYIYIYMTGIYIYYTTGIYVTYI